MDTPPACAPGAHYLCHRCCSLYTPRTPRACTRPVCSWRALLAPPFMQLAQSSHASSPYSTRVLLAHTTCTAIDADCAIFACLGHFLDPGYLAGTNCTADATACAVSERVGPLLDPGSLAGTNFLDDATACAVSECPGPLLDPGSLEDMNYPGDVTACAVSKRLGPLLDPSSLAGTNFPADTTACVVMTRPTMFQIPQSCESELLQAPSKASPQKPLVRAPR